MTVFNTKRNFKYNYIKSEYSKEYTVINVLYINAIFIHVSVEEIL